MSIQPKSSKTFQEVLKEVQQQNNINKSILKQKTIEFKNNSEIFNKSNSRNIMNQITLNKNLFYAIN